ncbi:hypothetical protein ElyMa_003588000 [Elysia marginata]|uniref:Uncharacterized protein n=1 Tax=Elysia marginata TaxID=1093978 RepID=A0AAV4EQH7_9GAST|nr:hypothetical protein ElyMa_003588000 [Elysia marginata]
MGDQRRTLVYTPPPTIAPSIPGVGGGMRGGVLEPLGSENCLPMHAVIVKNGRIFIDGMDEQAENESGKGGNDLEEGVSSSGSTVGVGDKLTSSPKIVRKGQTIDGVHDHGSDDVFCDKTTTENNNYINTTKREGRGYNDLSSSTTGGNSESSGNSQNHAGVTRLLSEESEKRLEEEIDRLEDDDAALMDGRFSQEAFDSFMRASDAEDDQLGDILLYNQLHGGGDTEDHDKENLHRTQRTLPADGSGHIDVCADAEEDNSAEEGRHQINYDLRDDHLLQYHYQVTPDERDPDHMDRFARHSQHFHGDIPGEFNHHIADDAEVDRYSHSSFPQRRSFSPSLHDFDGFPHYLRHQAGQTFPQQMSGESYPYLGVPTRAGSGCRRRDSLNLEEYSTFDEDVHRLLSEDQDNSWRYVPLYPESYYR